MFDDAKFQMDFVNKLSFNRYGGTEDEARAAALIQSEIGALGGKSELFEFQVPAYEVKRAKFEILEPYYREITVTGVGRTGSTPEGGLEADFAYVESAGEADCLDIARKDRSGERHRLRRLQAALDKGAAGFVVFSGTLP